MENILKLLENVKDRGDGKYTALCPAHDDKANSLSVRIEHDRILLHCFAGCSTEDIVSAMELSMKDLFFDKMLPYTVLKKQKINTITYDYRSAEGLLVYKKQRYEFNDGSKTFAFYKPDGSKGVSGVQRVPYNLSAVLMSDTIYFCEGEKCVDAIIKAGRVATTLDTGAKSKWLKEYKAYFKNKNIIILPDNDEPGMLYAKMILQELKNAKIVKLPDLPKGGDICDWLQQGHTIEEIDLLSADGSVDVKIDVKEKDDLYNRPYIFIDGEGKAKFKHPDFINYFENNVKYFIVKNRAYEKANFFLYNNSVYKLCDNNFLKSYIKKMLPLEFQKPRITNPLVEDLYDTMDTISYSDCNPENYINFKNGLFNLDTGKLEPHNPNILTTRQINSEYEPEADYSNCENQYFDAFINHFVGGDKSQIQLLLEFIGLAISNIPAYRYKQALFTVGAGNTGKTQLPKFVQNLIGNENYYSCKLNKLETSRFDSANLYNKRLATDPDMSFMHVKELELFKVLTGGDPISAEFKGQNGFNFIFDGLLWFCTNKLPQFGGDKGEHVYSRFCIIQAVGKTYKKGSAKIDGAVEADPNLLNKMLKEKPYVIRRALTALKVLVENQRFSETNKQREALETYKKTNSSVIQFFEECIVKRPIKDDNGDYKIEDTCTRATIYNCYVKWCYENAEYKEKKQDLFEYMEKKGGNIVTFDGYKYFKKYTLSLETKRKFKIIDGTQNL